MPLILCPEHDDECSQKVCAKSVYMTHQMTPLAGSHNDEYEELLLTKYSAIYWTKTRISCVPVLVDFLIRTLVNLVIQNSCLLLPRYDLHVKTLNNTSGLGTFNLEYLTRGT